MTKLYHPFPLKCFSEIQAHVLEYMEEFNQENIYIKHVPFHGELLSKLNTELASYNLSEAWNFLCFKRKNFITQNLNVHVDYSDQGSVVHSSIVIPIEGCAQTTMYWMTGEHDMSIVNLDGGGTYAKPIWKSIPKLLDSVEINDEPVITRVDIPHSVTSRKDGSYRTIISIRLKSNPSFEEVLHKRFNISL